MNHEDLMAMVADVFPGATVETKTGPTAGVGITPGVFCVYDEAPQQETPPVEDKKAMYLWLCRDARKKGHRVGSAYYRYRELYGSAPSREWLENIKESNG